MSRNVELSSEREKEPALSRTTGDAPASGAGEPRRPNLEARAREEATRCVQRVFLAPGASAPRVVVVCAAEPGDGCTWVCASLGKTLASLTKGSVCLVDANLRSPFLYRHFGGEGLRGLTVVDRGTVRSSARQLGSSNLWLMSCAEPASGAHRGSAAAATASVVNRLIAMWSGCALKPLASKVSTTSGRYRRMRLTSCSRISAGGALESSRSR